MFPKAIRVEREFVGHRLTAFTLNEALPLATLINDDDTQIGVNLPFTVPIAACGADFYFGRNNEFFAHIRFNSL